MFQKIRLFFRYTLAWIIVIGCIALIGFVLYPLLSEKYSSMALPSNTRYTGGYTVTRWYPLEITRNTEIIFAETQIIPNKITKLDAIQDIAEESVGKKTSNFFTQIREAFSTNTNKQSVTYAQDETGVYKSK
jgi:hypothetical protein